MKKVYVAGAYSADNVCDVLENMRKGMRLGTECLLAGFAPFVPWFDHHFTFMLREDEEIPLQLYYDYSMEFIKCADAVLVAPGWENSKGTIGELEVAKKLDIPIYYGLDALIIFECAGD